MEIILEKVKESRKEMLFRLLQYSLFEESLSDQNDMDEEAVYAYPWFDAYFKEKERAAFFIKEDGTGRLLGFVDITTPIISKKPVKPGKSRDRGTEFTTKLLLLD